MPLFGLETSCGYCLLLWRWLRAIAVRVVGLTEFRDAALSLASPSVFAFTIPVTTFRPHTTASYLWLCGPGVWINRAAKRKAKLVVPLG